MGEADRRTGAKATDPRTPVTDVVDPDGATLDASHVDLSAAASDVDDSLLAAVAAAPGAMVELEAGTVIGDSFRIERRLGAGGMGVVYLAQDQSLGRAVAVKLHRASTGIERLHREAMAMARLAHPNVITVHAVGRVGDSVFVAMEYVTGGTFKAWRKRSPRSWREVLDLCLAAGAGLAAAHDAGLVHRDFKPENIMVGEDGRARVGDFGLARAIDDEGPDLTPSTIDGLGGTSGASVSGGTGPGVSQRFSDRLTMTGAVLGTPAYMAPEQFVGSAVDARADQFAFAVVTWEALYGARPFAGTDIRELRAAIAAGAPTPPSRSTQVPARLRRVLARALAAAPADRYPSVRALLAELALAAQPRRRWTLVVGGLVGLAAAGTALAVTTRAQGNPCRTASADVDRILPASLVTRLHQVLAAASGDPGALALVDRRIASTRTELVDAARRVCKSARVTHELAPELEVRASACLRYRARASAVIIDDQALLRDAPATYALRLRQMPLLAACLDSVALTATPPPPAAKVAEARALLHAARADAATDRPDAARARIAEAEALGGDAIDPTNAALTKLIRGKLAYDGDRHAEAETLVTDAYYAAQAVDDADVYLEALAQLLRFYGDDRFEPTKLEPWIRTAEAVAQKDRRRAQPGVVVVLHALANAADRRGDGATALKWAEAAAKMVDGAVDPMVRADADYGLARAYAAAGRYEDARARYEAALPVLERTFGATHPSTVAVLTDYGLTLIEGSHDLEAREVAQRAKAALAAWPAARSSERASALLNLGVLLSGEPATFADARAAFVAARDLFVGLYGPDHPDVALAEVNVAVVDLKRGDAKGALAAYQRALAIQERVYGPDHYDVATTLFNVAAAALELHDFERARVAASRAAAIFTRTVPDSERHAFALVLEAKGLAGLGRADEAMDRANQAAALAARIKDDNAVVAASVEIARANILKGRALPDALARLKDARAAYGAYPDVYARRLIELDEIMAAHDRAARRSRGKSPPQ